MMSSVEAATTVIHGACETTVQFLVMISNISQAGHSVCHCTEVSNYHRTKKTDFNFLFIVIDYIEYLAELYCCNVTCS